MNAEELQPLPPAEPEGAESEKSQLPKHSSSSEEIRALVQLNRESDGLQQYPMTEALRSAGDVIRGQGAKVLLQTLSQLRETDLRDARAERKESETEKNSLRVDFFEASKRCAVLEERLRGEVKFKRLQNVMITLGGLVAGAAGQSLLDKWSGPALAGAIIGALLLLAGWFVPKGRAQEDSE